MNSEAMEIFVLRMLIASKKVLGNIDQGYEFLRQLGVELNKEAIADYGLPEDIDEDEADGDQYVDLCASFSALLDQEYRRIKSEEK